MPDRAIALLYTTSTVPFSATPSITPRSLIALRMLNFDASPIDEMFWRRTILLAASLRMKVLRLNEATDAFRVIHAEGDDISGLIVDRYADTLSVEVFSLGIWKQIPGLLPILP